MIVPLALAQFYAERKCDTSCRWMPMKRSIPHLLNAKFILIMGVSGLLFVPVFKTVTHLPPYMGMLLSLSMIWLISELLHKNKPDEVKKATEGDLYPAKSGYTDHLLLPGNPFRSCCTPECRSTNQYWPDGLMRTWETSSSLTWPLVCSQQ